MRSSAKEMVRELYEGHTPRAHRFRYWLLGFDLVAIAFVIITSFISYGGWIQLIDLVFGAVIVADLLARIWIAPRRLRFLGYPTTIADMVSAASFFAPLAGEGFAFLRVLRTLRLLHMYQTRDRLRQDFDFFRENEQLLVAATNLGVFIFVMSGFVFATQHRASDDIANYADALYFTVTALTTTGFGDITLEGTGGHMISVAIMICGVTLFLRLAQVLFRPSKVRHPCPTCGLVLHDPDAVHCKHCGTTLNIVTEGVV
ncbi:voltage-gated potassium channel [Limimaricola variabilis]|jgi:voltage-gated potassium channel|uniref:Voltage-gated potassium channel n=1 Tax=Limimaricola variabilis TaxID=1492771 RepID=A0ABR6HJP3_9RHOB|nr:potassium channel family protein [Limimaricola variabilis]MBB3710767.1 voltage-gated potassium channel [Limimaricola variabilis]WPY95326.1 potassium channel family protein [Limimaricola variabilis]